MDSPERSDSPADDATEAARVLSMEIGGSTVGASLEAAIAAGDVVRRPDGKLELARQPKGTEIYNGGEFGPDCVFLNNFMFAHIYRNAAVPIGCRDCYKIKVTPRTLRELIAVKTIAQSFTSSAKAGPEVDRPDNQSLYAAYFYFLGLDKARAAFKRLRSLLDADPKVGPSVKAVIKRGCTNYEHACGPSDRYTFDPRLAAIESYFVSRFVRKRPPRKHDRKYENAMKQLKMVRTAYRIGDDTYKDFTDGKDLYPPTVTYDPDPPAAAPGRPDKQA